MARAYTFGWDVVKSLLDGIPVQELAELCVDYAHPFPVAWSQLHFALYAIVTNERGTRTVVDKVEMSHGTRGNDQWPMAVVSEHGKPLIVEMRDYALWKKYTWPWQFEFEHRALGLGMLTPGLQAGDSHGWWKRLQAREFDNETVALDYCILPATSVAVVEVPSSKEQ